jgi:hypothetical protein
MTYPRKRQFEFSDFSDGLHKSIAGMKGPGSWLEVHLTIDNCIIHCGFDKGFARHLASSSAPPCLRVTGTSLRRRPFSKPATT